MNIVWNDTHTQAPNPQHSCDHIFKHRRKSTAIWDDHATAVCHWGASCFCLRDSVSHWHAWCIKTRSIFFRSHTNISFSFIFEQLFRHYDAHTHTWRAVYTVHPHSVACLATQLRRFPRNQTFFVASLFLWLAPWNFYQVNKQKPPRIPLPQKCAHINIYSIHTIWKYSFVCYPSTS